MYIYTHIYIYLYLYFYQAGHTHRNNEVKAEGKLSGPGCGAQAQYEHWRARYFCNTRAIKPRFRNTRVSLLRFLHFNFFACLAESMALDLRGEIPFWFDVDTPTISHGAREKPRQYPRQLEPIIKARAGISMDATCAHSTAVYPFPFDFVYCCCVSDH